MVEDILGVVYDVFVSRRVPPEASSYHLMSPALAVAAKATVPVPHLFPGVELVTVGTLETVAVTVVLEAEVHEPSTASA